MLRRGDTKVNAKIAQNGHRYTNGDSQSPSDQSNVGVILVKEEMPHSPGNSSPKINGILGVNPSNNVQGNAEEQQNYASPQLFATLSNPSNHTPYEPYPPQLSVVVSSPSQFPSNLRAGGGSITLSGASGIYTVTSPSEPYFREYYNDYGAATAITNTTTRQLSGYDGTAGNDANAFVDRYGRASVGGPYKTAATIDLPSPDSGIGVEAIPSRDQSNIQQVSFVIARLFLNFYPECDCYYLMWGI